MNSRSIFLNLCHSEQIKKPPQFDPTPIEGTQSRNLKPQTTSPPEALLSSSPSGPGVVLLLPGARLPHPEPVGVQPQCPALEPAAQRGGRALERRARPPPGAAGDQELPHHLRPADHGRPGHQACGTAGRPSGEAVVTGYIMQEMTGV